VSRQIVGSWPPAAISCACCGNDDWRIEDLNLAVLMIDGIRALVAVWKKAWKRR
jgi:hypothetical protein